MQYYIICVLLAFLIATEGHNWLITPKARDYVNGANVASTTVPCDAYAGEC